VAQVPGSGWDAIVTPEAVSLSVDVAGLGSRMIAAIIDSAIQIGAVIGLSFVFGALSRNTGGGSVDTALVVIYLVALFVLVWGYYPLFEGLWKGRTPGKRAQRIRVVRTDGQPVTIGPVLVRNLLRIVDFLPVYYVTGTISMIVTRKSQRIGDLAAGTIVIRERPMPAPAPLVLRPSETRSEAAVRVDAAGLTEREYGLIRSFLERRDSLDPQARRALAERLGEAFRARLRVDVTGLDPETLLEALAHAYQERFAGTARSLPAIPAPPPIPAPPQG